MILPISPTCLDHSETKAFSVFVFRVAGLYDRTSVRHEIGEVIRVAMATAVIALIAGGDALTFWTAGVCPGCGLQWPLTQCPQCGQVSPHRQWYREPEPSEADRVREVELSGT